MYVKCIEKIKALIVYSIKIGKIKKAIPSYLCLKHPVKNLLSIKEVKKVFGLINFQKLNFPNFPFQKKVERLINVNVIPDFFFIFSCQDLKLKCSLWTLKI